MHLVQVGQRRMEQVHRTHRNCCQILRVQEKVLDFQTNLFQGQVLQIHQTHLALELVDQTNHRKVQGHQREQVLEKKHYRIIH
jgi:hypothetical protein